MAHDGKLRPCVKVVKWDMVMVMEEGEEGGQEEGNR